MKVLETQCCGCENVPSELPRYSHKTMLPSSCSQHSKGTVNKLSYSQCGISLMCNFFLRISHWPDQNSLGNTQSVPLFPISFHGCQINLKAVLFDCCFLPLLKPLLAFLSIKSLPHLNPTAICFLEATKTLKIDKKRMTKPQNHHQFTP